MSPTTESDWIKDGTAEVEPVTVETPEAEPVEPVAEVAETAAEDLTVVEVEAPAEEVAAEAEEVAEAVQTMLEGRLGDEVFEYPEGLLIPQKRGEETEYVPIADLAKDGMRGNDYRLKTTELAQMRRTFDGERDALTSQQVRLEARSKYVDEREAEIKAALTDPKSAAAYEEHLAQYQNNDMYRRNVDAALTQHETAAELEALQVREDTRIVNEASSVALGWIESLKGEYEVVDPELVRDNYSRQLSAGQASLDISAVRSIYQAEKDYVDRTVSPLRSQLAEITAQLKVLQDGAAADQHNETTQHAVRRSKATPVATGSGAPARSPEAPTKFGPHELAARNSEWVKQAG